MYFVKVFIAENQLNTYQMNDYNGTVSTTESCCIQTSNYGLNDPLRLLKPIRVLSW